MHVDGKQAQIDFFAFYIMDYVVIKYVIRNDDEHSGVESIYYLLYVT